MVLRKLLLTTVLATLLCGVLGTKAGASPPIKERWLVNAFTCIHHYEGAWNSNTGNGYYGGLQMDLEFQSKYGSWYLKHLGTADNWSPKIQIMVAIIAYHSGRGFGPWPNTRRACGL